jgi:ABC-type multidrug transport system fused ATPase/permease subunit
MMLLNVTYQRKVDRHFVTAQHELGAFSEAAYESLEGYSVVKAFGAESREADRMASISERLREARIRAVRGRATFDGLMDAMPALINVLLVVIGAHRVQSGALTVGELSGFVYLFTLLVFPLRIIGYVFSELPHSRSGMDRIDEILDESSPAQPTVSTVRNQAHVAELENVSLGYGPDVVLRDVTFSVARGETVALVGPTGSGKSSLLMVVAGLLGADTGSVATGRTSIVFQEPFLFDGTIRDNVLLGDSDASLLDEALRISCTLEFLDELPAGLETPTGERGVGLSGGQRQRLALARALCRKNDLLLLDDTTSALDSTNELRVLQHLREMQPRPAVLMAASRPSAIRAADHIIFIAHGQIQGIGDHDELMERLKEYRELVTSYETGRSDG